MAYAYHTFRSCLHTKDAISLFLLPPFPSVRSDPRGSSQGILCEPQLFGRYNSIASFKWNVDVLSVLFAVLYWRNPSVDQAGCDASPSQAQCGLCQYLGFDWYSAY